MKKRPLLNPRNAVLAAAMFAASMALIDPAFAQVLDPVVRASNIVRDTTVQVCLALLTVGWGMAGYKIMFSGANFRDVSGPLIGGAIAGSAAAIAALFMT
jgi:hypothetical protein